jgi:hypothetical protein
MKHYRKNHVNYLGWKFSLKPVSCYSAGSGGEPTFAHDFCVRAAGIGLCRRPKSKKLSQRLRGKVMSARAEVVEPIARALALIITVVAQWLIVQPARADCGLDPICHISESIGNGAGRGIADSVRPLVTDVMEREAPALIAQLQAGVDHNIITAEQAGEKLTAYATSLLNKAADDLLAHAQDRAQKLVDYARDQTIAVEQQIFNDVQMIIGQLQCTALGVVTLLDRQQKIFDDNVNNWLQRILVWQNRKDQIEGNCRTELGIHRDIHIPQLGVPTTFALWRCIRLAYVDLKGPSTAVRDAFDDVVSNGKATMCALQTGADVALRRVTEIWINDSQSARAWDRAIRGE